MSMATLEREILAEAKNVLNNQKLRKADIQEWSTGPIQEVEGEVVVSCPVIGVYVAVKIACDKRKGTS